MSMIHVFKVRLGGDHQSVYGPGVMTQGAVQGIAR